MAIKSTDPKQNPPASAPTPAPASPLAYSDDPNADALSLRTATLDAQSNVSAVQGQINDVNQSISGFSANLSSINSQVQIQTTLLSTLGNQLTGLQAQRGQPNLSDSQKRDLDSQIQALGQRIAFIREQVSSLRGQATDVGNQLAASQGKADDLRTSGLQRAEGLDRTNQLAADNQRQANDAQQAQEDQSQQQSTQLEAAQRQKREAASPLDIDYSAEGSPST